MIATLNSQNTFDVHMQHDVAEVKKKRRIFSTQENPWKNTGTNTGIVTAAASTLLNLPAPSKALSAASEALSAGAEEPSYLSSNGHRPLWGGCQITTKLKSLKCH